MEDWVTIRNLRNRGISIREITRLMGVSRNTVRRAIKREGPPQYNREEKLHESLIPFSDYIRDNYLIKRLRGSRILSDIESKGYTGSRSSFYRYLKKLSSCQSKKSYKPYETEPGEQAQFDWSPYTVLIGSELVKIYIHIYLLGYSRYRVYWVSLGKTQPEVFEAIEQGLEQTGGVPQRSQVDNAKCFVTNASSHDLVWNKNYLNLCGHYGIQPTRSLPAHPWSKGKVERPFDYLETHFIKENNFDTFEDLVEKLNAFQDKVNSKVHDTTRQKPKELLEVEQQFMAPLPINKYVGIAEELRKVSADCLISYNGSKYSVPHYFVGKQVWIRSSQGCYIHIYSSGGKCIAQHRLSQSKGKVMMKDEHYKNHSVERGNWKRMTQTFLDYFPDYEPFIKALKVQKQINPSYHLTRIIELTSLYSHDLFRDAFQVAQQYNCYNYSIIQALVEHKAAHHTTSKPKPFDYPNIKNLNNQDISRDLSEYNC